MLTAFSVGTSSNKAPADDDVIAVVAAAPDGMDAQQLTRYFLDRGYDLHAVQRVIQRSLDRGSMRLGTKLRFFAKTQHAA